MNKFKTLLTCLFLFQSISYADYEMDLRKENSNLKDEISELQGKILRQERQIKRYKDMATKANVQLRKMKHLCDRNNIDYSNLDDVKVERKTGFDVVKDTIKERLGKSNRTGMKRVWGISRGHSEDKKSFIYVKWSKNTGTSVESDIEHIIFSIIADKSLKYDAVIMQCTSSHTDDFGNISEAGSFNIGARRSNYKIWLFYM